MVLKNDVIKACLYIRVISKNATSINKRMTDLQFSRGETHLQLRNIYKNLHMSLSLIIFDKVNISMQKISIGSSSCLERTVTPWKKINVTSLITILYGIWHYKIFRVLWALKNIIFNPSQTYEYSVSLLSYPQNQIQLNQMEILFVLHQN